MRFKLSKKTEEQKVDEAIAELKLATEAQRARHRKRKKEVEVDENGVPLTRRMEGKVNGRRQGTPYEVNWDAVDKLLLIQCTQKEIAGFLGISLDTIRRRCKQDHGMTFKKYAEDKSAGGRASLRRKQWLHAEKSPAMAMFMGKQYLGQSDKVETKNINTNAEVDLSKLSTSELDALENLMAKAELKSTDDE